MNVIRLGLRCLLVCALIATITSKSSAELVINGNFRGGEAPANAAGDGTLVEIFDVAADLWELLILDDHTVNIDFSWGQLSGPTLSQTTIFAPPVPFSLASIVFDNDQSTAFYLDPTPHDNSEWTDFTATTADLGGGGTLNAGRVFSGAVGDAVGRHDMLNVAMHEIGHALGLVNVPSAGFPLSDPISITAPLSTTTGVIQTVLTGGGHIDAGAHPHALMIPSIAAGDRTYPSDVDILATASNVGFSTVNLSAISVPEPTHSVLGVLGFIAVCANCWRRGTRPVTTR